MTIAEAFDQAFKYKIGDLIITRGVFERIKLDCETVKPLRYGDRISMPQAEPIIERWVQQCHGGTQVFYLLRRYNPDTGADVLHRLTEAEIVSYEEAAQLVRAHAAKKPEKDGD